MALPTVLRPKLEAVRHFAPDRDEVVRVRPHPR
jgi:hypothetical protein